MDLCYGYILEDDKQLFVATRTLTAIVKTVTTQLAASQFCVAPRSLDYTRKYEKDKTHVMHKLLT